MIYVQLMNDPDAKFRHIEAQSKELASQAYLIKRIILDCALLYPGGDNGTIYNIAYPAGDVPTPITSLTCPGAPYADKNIWRGETGAFVPKTLTGWAVWSYTNDGASIRIDMVGDSTNADAVNILTRAAKEFSAGETLLTPSSKMLTVYLKK